MQRPTDSLSNLALSDLELGSERLLLRRWRPDDAARVHEVMRDRSMHEFLAVPDPYTVQDADEFVTGAGHEGRDEGTGLGCAVVDRARDQVVGSAALRFAGHHPEIGYWIAPDARGRGYATEATSILARFGLEHGLPRIGLFCDVRNIASAVTALRAGFRFEGVLRDGAPAGGRGRADLACFGRLPGDPGGPIAPTFPALPPGGLTDGGLVLRPIDEDDAEPLAETDDDPLTRANGFGLPPESADDIRRYCAGGPLQWLVGRAVRCAIVDAATGDWLGSLAVRQSGPPGVAVLGYVVHPAARGRGVAGRALRLVGPWLLANGFGRLELGAKVDNVASQRAALAGGFAPDGTMRGRLRGPDGSFSDEARFYRLAD